MRALPPLPSLCLGLLWRPCDTFVRHPQACGRRRQRGILGVGAPPALELQNAEPALLDDPGLNGHVLNGNSIDAGAVDRRPHEQQRVSGPRKARRLNHPFQHLYRHSDPRWSDNEWNETAAISDEVAQFYASSILSKDRLLGGASIVQHNSTFAEYPIDDKTSMLAIQYLQQHGGYTLDEIGTMHARFPPLLEMDVIRHLRPKMRFLKDCIGGATSEGNLDPQLRDILPASFFGSRLERTIAPRHAFLVHNGLPSGRALWDGTYTAKRSKRNGSSATLLEGFLLQHCKPKQFAAMCNKWRSLYGSSAGDRLPITSEQIIAFDKLFQRGILSAARNDSAYLQPGDSTSDNSSPTLLHTANVTSAELIRYLIQHGSNPWETDVRGASLFHWAAGCGNLEGLQELVACCNRLEYRRVGDDVNGTSPKNPGVQAALLWKAARDDATPLHWAAAGAGPKEFGVGGHISVCTFILSLCTEYPIISQRKLIESATKDGNTVLMWSSWSRSLDVVKLLVRNRADTTKANRNGCTVAHWAASGGDLSVCQYLHSMANVDFTVENHARNTPLSHAVAYGRYDVAKWLRDDLKVEDVGGNAEDLAADFVSWADMGVGLITGEEETERRSVYALFNSWREEMGEDEADVQDDA
ncbi:hypothetical protein ACHAXT_007341 [Thalassiosira profunda]